MNSVNHRVLYIDVLNVLSCLSVVCLHQNYIVHNFSPNVEWNISCIIENVFIFAVPVFFMLTGANLIGYHKKYSTKIFFSKRVKKTFVPFLLFSFFAYFFLLLRGKVELQLNPIYCIYSLYTCDWMPIYWFFIPLFFIYLFMPILTYFSDIQQCKLLYLIALLAFICTLPLLNIFCIERLPYTSNSLFGPLMYVLIGYYLKNFNFNNRINRTIYLLAIFFFCLRCYVMLKYSWQNGETYYGLNSLYYITIIIPAVAVFIFMKNCEQYFISIQSVISVLSPLTFGIYLIHNHIIYVEGKVFGPIDTFVSYRVVLMLLTLTISGLIVYGVRRSKYLSFLFP